MDGLAGATKTGPPANQSPKKNTLPGSALACGAVSRNRNRAHPLFFAPAGGQIDFNPGQHFAQIVDGVIQSLDRNLPWSLPPAAIGHQTRPCGFPQPGFGGVNRWRLVWPGRGSICPLRTGRFGATACGGCGRHRGHRRGRLTRSRRAAAHRAVSGWIRIRQRKGRPGRVAQAIGKRQCVDDGCVHDRCVQQRRRDRLGSRFGNRIGRLDADGFSFADDVRNRARRAVKLTGNGRQSRSRPMSLKNLRPCGLWNSSAMPFR